MTRANSATSVSRVFEVGGESTPAVKFKVKRWIRDPHHLVDQLLTRPVQARNSTSHRLGRRKGCAGPDLDRVTHAYLLAPTRVVDVDLRAPDAEHFADRSGVVARRRAAGPAEEDLCEGRRLLLARVGVDIQSHAPRSANLVLIPVSYTHLTLPTILRV